MDIEGEHDSWENRTTNQDMRVGPCDLGSNVSDQEMTLHDDHNNNALGQCDGGRDAMEDSRDDASSGSLGPTAHDAAEASPTDRATLTDATTVNDDDDFEAQQQLIRESDPKQGARPRRSLGRVSYVEVFAHELSDHELDSRHELTEDDDSDAYVSNASVESEIDQDSVLGESVDESSTMDDGSGVDEDEDEGEEPISVGADTRASKSAKKSSTRRDGSTPKAGKGIDFSLPPLGNIEDIFADLASKAVELGLTDVIKKLNGRHINVATMCSGTESPLLALEMLSKALENAGLPSIKVNHHFSAEIEVVKQGYIERNFAPSKLFRDVRDFIRENSTTAVTAYGAEESIPACLDILIAGFVCKDLSRLNTRQKDLDSDGESGDTWRAIYSYAERFRPSIVLLENVKSTSSLWDKVVSKWAEIDYEAAWLICDTKRYYVPQTRERMYMIAIERSQFGKNADKAVEQWRDLMLKLQRQCSSPYEAFLKNMLHESSDHSALVSEPDWALCKLRYDHIRSDERLGILRPVTRWSENGTVRYVMPRIEALSLKLSLT
jgi:site-specific DNA-cytosine methylase